MVVEFVPRPVVDGGAAEGCVVSTIHCAVVVADSVEVELGVSGGRGKEGGVRGESGWMLEEC